jgi:hypothetical protein
MVKSPYNIKINETIIPSFISKPEQGSKSYEFSKLIHRDLNENPNTLSIYICPCRRNQADQAESNFKQYNQYFKDDKHMIDTLHGDKQSSKDTDGFIYRANEEGMRLIISLCHKVRLNVIKNIIIKWISLNLNNKIKIYLDEAGESRTFNAFINHIWMHLEEPLERRLTNVFPIFIDAHSKALVNNKNFLKYFPTQAIKKLKNDKNLDNYMFMSSMKFNPFEWNNTYDILNDILNGNTGPINYDDYILWPSPKIKDDQYDDAEEISSMINDSCTLIINGEGFHLYINRDGKSEPKVTLPKRKCGKKRKCNHITCPKCNTDCKDDGGMSAIKIIKKNYAHNIPLIISGHDCIDRAMTYHEKGFTFTKVFISRDNLLENNFTNNSGKTFDELSPNIQEKVSQMVKRISGSFMESLLKEKNPLPIVYGPQDMYDGICKLENISAYISNQEPGYLTKDLRNAMDNENKMLCQHPLLREQDIENAEKDREPYDYYMKKFNHDDNLVALREKLSKFRENIGGSHIQKRAIQMRLNGIEPDLNLGELHVDMFENDHKLLKTALDENTASRIRVCKGERDEKIWIIHFQMKREEFKWDGVNYKITKINGDGDCVFNCFIGYGIIDLNLKSFRREICKELRNNKQFYDSANIYDEDKWEDICEEVRQIGRWAEDIFDYVLIAISKKYDINIHIYNLKTMTNEGYEVINDFPTIIPDNKCSTHNIHLRRLDDNHYDLMIPQ